MPYTPEISDWTRLLEGTWTLGASNRLIWLDGTRTAPIFRFKPVDGDARRVSAELEFDTASGVHRTLFGSARLVPGRMVVRQRGNARAALDRFTLSGADEQGSILVLRHETFRRRPNGLSVLVRPGIHPDVVRAEVASQAAAFGLESDDFARLSWLSPTEEETSEF